MSKGFVLIVEDDPEIGSSITDLLDMEGYRSKTVLNGQRALDWLAASQEAPDVILLDLMMPVFSGYEFLESVREHERLLAIPVIIISAAADARSTAQKHHAGFVKKPLDADDLLKAIARAGD